MTALSASEIAQMKADNQGHMMDTAQIKNRSDTLNDRGQPVPAWTTTATSSCGFEFSPFKFRGREVGTPGEETAEIYVRARFPKAQEGNISVSSRIVLTHRYGTALDTPQTYEVHGYPEVGPSGLILNLRRTQP